MTFFWGHFSSEHAWKSLKAPPLRAPHNDNNKKAGFRRKDCKHKNRCQKSLADLPFRSKTFLLLSYLKKKHLFPYHNLIYISPPPILLKNISFFQLFSPCTSYLKKEQIFFLHFNQNNVLISQYSQLEV